MVARTVSAAVPKEKISARSRILGMAAGMGLLAALLGFVWLQNIERKAAGRTVVTLPVVVAACDIPARTLVTKELLQVRSVASSNMPAEAVAAPTDLIGKVTTLPVVAGAPVTQHMVAARDINMGMAYALPPATRAIAIPLDPVAGVAGFIKPGDHVDVLTTYVETNGVTIARTVLENVTLLATGTRVLPGYTPPTRDAVAPPPAEAAVAKPEEMPNATLMVTPDEAQTLMLAAARGKLQLILRPADDPTRPAMFPALTKALGTASATGAHSMRLASPVSSPHAAYPLPTVSRSAVSVRRQRPHSLNSLEAHSYGGRKLDTGASPLARQNLPQTGQAVPQIQRDERQVTLMGVLQDQGQEACAILKIGDISLVRERGEIVAGCKLVRIFERGILIQSPGHAAEQWLIGDSRRLPTMQP